MQEDAFRLSTDQKTASLGLARTLTNLLVMSPPGSVNSSVPENLTPKVDSNADC